MTEKGALNYKHGIPDVYKQYQEDRAQSDQGIPIGVPALFAILEAAYKAGQRNLVEGDSFQFGNYLRELMGPLPYDRPYFVETGKLRFRGDPGDTNLYKLFIKPIP